MRLLTGPDLTDDENKLAIGRGERRKIEIEEPWNDPHSGWCDTCRRMPCQCEQSCS